MYYEYMFRHVLVSNIVKFKFIGSGLSRGNNINVYIQNMNMYFSKFYYSAVPFLQLNNLKYKKNRMDPY